MCPLLETECVTPLKNMIQQKWHSLSSKVSQKGWRNPYAWCPEPLCKKSDYPEAPCCKEAQRSEVTCSLSSQQFLSLSSPHPGTTDVSKVKEALDDASSRHCGAEVNHPAMLYLNSWPTESMSKTKPARSGGNLLCSWNRWRSGDRENRY